MKNLFRLFCSALFFGLFAVICTKIPVLGDDLENQEDPVVNFIVASDIHYQPEVSGIAAALIPQVAYIDEILDAFIAEVLIQAPQALILCGDITNNGRYGEHAGFIQKLEPLKASGISIFVLPGNHDITPDSAASFPVLYEDFGYGQALYRDEHSLSYVVAASDKFWWLLLDTTLSGEPAYVKDGILCSETLDWISRVLAESQTAGITVLSAGHHNILNPAAELYSYDRAEGSQTLIDLFMRYNVPLYVSGHRHHHSILTEPSGNTGFTEISEAMLADYPNLYGQLSINRPSRDIAYQTRAVDVESWALQKSITDPNLLNFKEFSKQCNQQLCNSIASGMMKELPNYAEEHQPIREFLADTYMAFYDGTLYQKREHLLQSDGYQLWKTYAGSSDQEKLFDYMLEYLTQSHHTYNISY